MSHLIEKLYEINHEALEAKAARFAYDVKGEAEKWWNKILDNSYEGPDGIRRWISNNAVIPVCVLENDACLIVPDEHRAAYDAETAAFFAEYRLNQPAEPTDEERFEARAAHGPGVELVDVITGRRWTT